MVDNDNDEPETCWWCGRDGDDSRQGKLQRDGGDVFIHDACKQEEEEKVTQLKEYFINRGS